MTPHSESSTLSSDPSRRGTTPPLSYVRTNRISCDPCRKRKLKCDRVKPCSTCIKRGMPDRCYQEERGGLREESGTSDTLTTKRPKREDTVIPTNVSDEQQISNATSDKVQIAKDMAKWKDQIDAIVKIASQSSTSIGGMLTELSSGGKGCITAGSPPLLSSRLHKDELVVWRDVSAHLPSIEDCEALIAFYFDELCSYFRISQRPFFEKQWRLLLDGIGIHHTEAAIIFTALALADILIPSASPIRRHSRDDHHRWMTLLGDPAYSPLGKPVDNSYRKIKLLGMVAIYHLYEGRIDHLWESVGVAMRKAIMFGLFDERTKSWLGLSNLEREYKRRLAWYLLVLDRSQAFVRQPPFALNPTHVFLAEPSFESDSFIQRSTASARIVPNRPTLLPDGRLQNNISARRPGNVKFVFVELLDWCQDYLSNFAAMDPTTRYNRALLLDDVLERILLDGLHHTGIGYHDLRFLSTSILDQCIKERHVEVISYICKIFFMRCMITRRFLTDENAPSHLRWVSLIYAQGVLSTIPSLTRLMNEGRVPVQTTWLSNFLLAAATTFTVVILGQDHYVESQSNPLDANTSEQGYREGFPQQHVEWLAENIFVVLDCLDTIVNTGNYSASMAKQLLERLCMAQGDLRNLYRVRINRLAEGGKLGQVHHQQYPFNQHNECNTSFQVSAQEHSHLQSKSLYSSPTDSFGASPASFPANASTSSSFHSGAHPMSATSLLDAVLQEPTELDFLGQNHMDLLQSLLKDSPPMGAGRGFNLVQ